MTQADKRFWMVVGGFAIAVLMPQILDWAFGTES